MSENKKIYVSLTSISNRQNQLFDCLKNLLSQSLLPNEIVIYLSEDKSFLCKGFTDKKITSKKLKRLLENKIFRIIWGNDIGPYGKLLPILKEKWTEDCLIITLDDDTIYDRNLIKNLAADYYKHQCVISYRCFTPDINNIKNFVYLGKKINKTKFLLNFPSGKGGILYHPEFFHKTKDLIFRDDLYKKLCKTADDLWFMFIRVFNNIDCYRGDKAWLGKDLHDQNSCLYQTNNGQNQKYIDNLIKKFKELDYIK